MSTTVRSDPWGRFAFLALRKWWWIPSLGAVLAVAAGFVGVALAPAKATAYASVEAGVSTSFEMSEQAAAAVRESQTSAVLAAAAKELDITPKELEDSTKIGIVQPSQVVYFRATALDRSDAVLRANALARAAALASIDRVRTKVETVTFESEHALDNQPLRNTAAEKSRVKQFGASVGSSQASLVAGSRRLLIIQEADPLNVDDLPMLPIVLASGIGGALLGTALVLLIGPRRGRVKGLGSLSMLFPDGQVLGLDSVRDVVASGLSTQDLIGVCPVGVDDEALDKVGEQIGKAVEPSGRGLRVSDDHHLLGRGPGDGMRAVEVVQLPALRPVVKRAMADPNAVSLLVVEPGTTRIKDIDRLADGLTGDAFVVVV